MRRRAIVACAFAALTLIPEAAAQPGDEAKPSASSEEILLQELPSVFGASKYEQKTSEAPALVTIITAEEIATYGYRTLADILRSVPGLYATYDRNYTYLGVRGFLRPGDYNSRVLLLIDGHRTNDNLYDSSFYGTESLIDVEMIERLEVISGPASSLYGTNAFFAVINIITRSGRVLDGTADSADGGSYGTYRGHAEWGARPARGPETILSATAMTSAGQDLFFPEFDDPATNNGVAEGADGDSFRSAFGKLSTGHFVLEGAYKTREKSIPAAPFGIVFNDDRSQTVDTRYYGSLAYDAEVAPGSRIAASLAYDYYRYDGTYAYSYGLFRDYAHGRWWTGELSWSVTPGTRQRVIAGTEARRNFTQDQGAYDPLANYLQDRRDSGLWALYAQDEIRASDKVLINAGVRYDRYDTFGGTTNPRLAVILAVAPRASPKLMYGRAFNAPNAYELYYADGTTQKGNLDLDPETIDTFEIAWEQTVAGGLRTAVAVYQYNVNDLISQEIDPNDGFLVFENVDRARARGADLSLEGHLGPHLEGRFSYSYQDAVDASTGERLTNSPGHMAKVNLSAPLLGEKLAAGFEAQFMSSRMGLQGGSAVAHTITNLTLTSRGWAKGVSLTGGVYNLFDSDYGDPVGGEFVQETLPQDGRTFRFQVRFQF